MEEKLRVLLAQLPVPSAPSLNTPLAAGYLAAYAESLGLAAVAEITLLPRALADHAGDAALVEAIVARAPHVLGLSLYTWNSERSLAIALRARARLPGLVVVVGGPEVQPDNPWVLEHPAVDVAVIGEGEQTFAELVRALADARRSSPGRPPTLGHVPGLALRSPGGGMAFTGERAALGDLGAVPSPYLGGWLELPPGGVQMVEISRWCPYSCSFCLYGRNMGPRLGSRYFGLERVLGELAWGKARGVRAVHFVEANLNLVPLFWPLMRALADLNADRQITFYAELRGEHLTDEVVAALDAANVRVVEVGLQTANPVALRAAHRRTDLTKWAAGTRRLYARGIEVYLDVILGLPADDAAGVAETLAFIEREGLGPYDIFTLQVLPGTAVRREAAQQAMRFQSRPPYYVLATDRLPFPELRRLRRELKLGAGIEPDAIEGVPAPREDALGQPELEETADSEVEPGAGAANDGLLRRLELDEAGHWRAPGGAWQSAAGLDSALARLAAHVDVVAPALALGPAGALVAQIGAASPSTVVDLYLRCAGEPPPPDALRAWRESVPHAPGYLDRVAVYAGEGAGGGPPEPDHGRVSPRIFLALPWTALVEPAAYTGVAAVIWIFRPTPDAPLPLGAWRSAGGAGIYLDLGPAAPGKREALLAEARAWAAEHGRILWW